MINFSARGSGAAAAEPPERGGLRVLLVEDNSINILVATGLLRRYGCDVEVAGDGKSGVEKVLTQNYDLVLMDLHMPTMDGYEATRAIRAAEATRNKRTPIVAITATAIEEARQRCISVGMDGYINKPFRAQHVVELIAEYLPVPH